MQLEIFLQSEIPSWQLTGGGVEFVGKGIIVLTSELSAQLEKFPHGEASVLVPEGSYNERGKMYAKGKAVFNLLWKWLIF